MFYYGWFKTRYFCYKNIRVSENGRQVAKIIVDEEKGSIIAELLSFMQPATILFLN